MAQWSQTWAGDWAARAGRGRCWGAEQARGVLNSMLLRQSSMLAYIDAFYVLSVSALVMIPLVMLMRSNKPGHGGGGMH